MMKWLIVALCRIIDFIESIPYNIQFAFAVAWLVISWPFQLMHMKRQARRIDRQLKKGYSSFYSEGE